MFPVFWDSFQGTSTSPNSWTDTTFEDKSDFEDDFMPEEAFKPDDGSTVKEDIRARWSRYKSVNFFCLKRQTVMHTKPSARTIEFIVVMVLSRLESPEIWCRLATARSPSMELGRNGSAVRSACSFSLGEPIFLNIGRDWSNSTNLRQYWEKNSEWRPDPAPKSTKSKWLGSDDW